jgi:hypothetical protein
VTGTAERAGSALRPGAGTTDGLATLGPDALALRTALDRIFTGWGLAAGAAPMAYPALMRVEDLARLDYWTNFPHLALVATGVDSAQVKAVSARGGALSRFAGPDLEPAQYALPSAACYNVYLDLSGAHLDEVYRVTTVATCFRRESHYDSLRRLLGFTMREIVCVGPREPVLEHIAAFKARTAEFAARLDLPLTPTAASDPFFDPDASRSLMAKLFPVKEEFVYPGGGATGVGDGSGGLAIASVNFHRNFFGERCEIRTADGEPAFSSCAAFGLERWLAALADRFGPNYPDLLARVLEAEAP